MTLSTLLAAPDATTASGTAACAEPVRFFLGTHQPHWLRMGVPLFVSDRRLRRYRRLPRAAAPWALDSGGFTELSQYGSWDTGPTPAQYAARVRRYRAEVGRLEWAAPQDWMCEPFILAKTGLTVTRHQDLTIDSVQRLRDLDAELPVIEVVQGRTPADYLRCADRYLKRGIDLSRSPLVGVGSVCRRQSTTQVGDILTALHQAGITRLHAFGFKTLGLARWGHLLTSADSMAWSAQARRQPALPDCHTHRTCANCSRYALRWRDRVLTTIAAATRQPALFDINPAWWPA